LQEFQVKKRSKPTPSHTAPRTLDARDLKSIQGGATSVEYATHAPNATAIEYGL
jgi:hypothetical protein